MTTIVASRTAIYADSYCNTTQPFETNKLHRVKHGEDMYLVGGCGDLRELEFMARMITEHGLDDMWKLHFKPEWPPKILKSWETEVIVVTEGKQIFIIDNTLVPCLVDKQVHCIGSGGDWASAHLELVQGSTPESAIRYAATRDDNTRAPVHKITFKSRSNLG